MDKGAAFDATKICFNDLDQGNDEKLWEISSDLLKLKTAKEDVLRRIQGIREPIGKILERDLQLNGAMPLIEPYPDGEYGKVV